jgi:hypothetical protein
MSSRAKIELCTATGLFIALGSGTTIARGHLAGDLFVLAFAPLLAAGLTLIARVASERVR